MLKVLLWAFVWWLHEVLLFSWLKKLLWKMVMVTTENPEQCPARKSFKACFSLSAHSPPPRKARALYACKAEHDSELSFIAGTIFENGEFPGAWQTHIPHYYTAAFITVYVWRTADLINSSPFTDLIITLRLEGWICGAMEGCMIIGCVIVLLQALTGCHVNR